MNSNWIVSFVAPRDIAMHPNFLSDEKLTAPRSLATRLKDWRVPAASDARETWTFTAEEGQLLRASENAFLPQESARARSELQEIAQDSDDAALATTAALFACVSFADAEEYSSLFDTIDLALTRLNGDARGEVGVLRSLLHLQRALRLGETRQDGMTDAAAALNLIDSISASELPEVALSLGVGWDSDRTWERVLTEISRIAESHLATGDPFTTDQRWMGLVRSELAPVSMEMTGAQAEGFEHYVEEQFNSLTRDSTLTWTSSDRVDSPVVNRLLRLELLGSRAAQHARKSLGQLRLLRDQGAGNTDALRLIRQSTDVKSLNRAAQHMRANGPLASVMVEASVVLRNRRPEWWREVDFAAVSHGGDLLSVPEAASGYEQLQAMVEGEQRPTLRLSELDSALSALSTLGRRASLHERMAAFALNQVSATTDQLTLRSYARMLDFIDWDRVTDDLKSDWRAWLDSSSANSDYWSVRLAASAHVGVNSLDDGQSVPPRNLADIAEELNARLRSDGEGVSPSRAEAISPLLIQAISAQREEANRGVFSFGGLNSADLAVILGSHHPSPLLWNAIAAFLLDPEVPREFKTPSLERLVALRSALPSSTALVLRDGYDALSNSQQIHARPGSSTVFPSALRLGVMVGVPSTRVLSDITRLSNGMPIDRVEAARTLELLCELVVPVESWVYSLTTLLCRDRDATVRAFSGRGLAKALLAPDQRDLEAARTQLLAELIGDDGVLVPNFVIQGLLKNDPSRGCWEDSRIVAALRVAAKESQGPSVREAAADALARYVEMSE